MGSKAKSVAGAALLAGVLFSTQATAVTPEPQGTLMVSAEHLATTKVSFWNGGNDWHSQVLGAPGSAPFHTPRLGVDYFVIDGLSLGGHVATGFNVPDNGGNVQGYVALIPRIGYLMQLSEAWDFWPRLGAGFVAGGLTADTGVVELEALFLVNLTNYFAIEFGPSTDFLFSNTTPNAIVGANAGFVVKF